MNPKYKVGELVKVFEYYADGDIVKGVYRGLIVGLDVFKWNSSSHSVIYKILPNDRTEIDTAEEYAIEPLEV